MVGLCPSHLTLPCRPPSLFFRCRIVVWVSELDEIGVFDYSVYFDEENDLQLHYANTLGLQLQFDEKFSIVVFALDKMMLVSAESILKGFEKFNINPRKFDLFDDG